MDGYDHDGDYGHAGGRIHTAAVQPLSFGTRATNSGALTDEHFKIKRRTRRRRPGPPSMDGDTHDGGRGTNSDASEATAYSSVLQVNPNMVDRKVQSASTQSSAPMHNDLASKAASAQTARTTRLKEQPPSEPPNGFRASVAARRPRRTSAALGASTNIGASNSGNSSHSNYQREILLPDEQIEQAAALFQQSLAATMARGNGFKSSGTTAARPTRTKREHINQRNNNSNNDEDDNEDERRLQTNGRMLTYRVDEPETPVSSSLQADWGFDDGGPPIDPPNIHDSRTRRHRNLSTRRYHDGDDGEDAEVNALSNLPLPPSFVDRPPSRQRHAFPTHLIDEDDPLPGMVVGPFQLQRSNNVSPTLDERPPSRYMTKAKRAAASGSNSRPAKDDTPEQQGAVDGRLPSRRGLDGIHGSWNQAHHDPRTDGFAEVDESIPPPFRIEITTDSLRSRRINMSSASSSSSSSSTSSNQDYAQQRKSLQSRRSGSFTNQEHLRQLAAAQAHVQPLEFTANALNQGLMGTRNPLQWFKDDQINDAHLFETVRSPAPHETERFHDHGLTHTHDRAQHVETAGLPVAGVSLSDHQWIRSYTSGSVSSNSTGSLHTSSSNNNNNSNNNGVGIDHANPFFHPSATDFDLMDPETAIAYTPLYASGELMPLENAVSDLHLDDFSGAEPSLSSSLAHCGLTAGGNSNSTPAPLNTSLGHDFLSLFAQH
ncbi:TPA: hypothetical protein N0F65_007478 [Lagenidium giganteum]|uniref:Uncharacterized protein n=1 Tax=Lagenidium giganteum TaxID=4803 RepID=A0AAV2ZHA8_9STRA|nr:TPA: hypothetical protein N0F65_007478 [Lagenidium giganteum]